MNASIDVAGTRGSLQRRIVASVLLGLAVVLVGIAVLVGLAVTQSLQAALTERLAVAYAKEHEMAQEIDDALSALTRIAASRTSPTSHAGSEELTFLLGATGEFTAHAIVDRQGRVVGAGAPAPWLPAPENLRALLAVRRPVVFGGQGKPSLILATPIPPSGAAESWLVAEMDASRLVRHLTVEHSVHGTYEAELLTETGSVAAGFPTSEGVSTHAGLVAGFTTRGEAGVVAHRVPGGAGDHYVAYVPLQPMPGWGVIVEQPRDIVIALPQRLWRWMMGIGLFVLLAGAGVAWVDVRRVVMPLRRLAHLAERFGRGDLETGIQLDRDDEIGLLGKTLEEMRVRLQASQAEVRSLSALTERERIARELHDGLAQALGIIYAQAKAAGEQLPTPTDPTGTALRAIAGISAQAYEEVRQSIFGLRTMVARRLGLVPALAEYLHEFSEHTGVRVELIVPDRFPRLPLEVEAQLIRIVQEALTNVWRHARAPRAWVRFAVEDDRVQVMVEDDGIGFDGTRAPSADVRRFGLEAMRERAESIGGRLQIESAPGRGTRVSLTLPLGASPGHVAGRGEDGADPRAAGG